MYILAWLVSGILLVNGAIFDIFLVLDRYQVLLSQLLIPSRRSSLVDAQQFLVICLPICCRLLILTLDLLVFASLLVVLLLPLPSTFQAQVAQAAQLTLLAHIAGLHLLLHISAEIRHRIWQ